MGVINFTANYELFASQTDADDSGSDADVVPLIGPVTFTPLNPDYRPVQAVGYKPRPAGLVVRQFVGYLDVDGRLKAVRGGPTGVRLWANDPVLQRVRLTYRVDFDVRTPQGSPVRVDAGYFDAPATDKTVDLAAVLSTFERLNQTTP